MFPLGGNYTHVLLYYSYHYYYDIQDDDDDETIVSLDDLKDDARSEAADSEDHDRPSESDDASVVNMSLQTSLFGDSLPNSPSSFIQR